MSSDTKIRVKQIRGLGGRPERTRRTLEALGLGRIGKSKEFTPNKAVLGMLRKVEHMIVVERI